MAWLSTCERRALWNDGIKDNVEVNLKALIDKVVGYTILSIQNLTRPSQVLSRYSGEFAGK
jgi:hypothetical protein